MESITKQLVNIGHGMSAEVAKDEPAVAKLLVELSSALDVQYERGNAFEARCAALAADNAGLKAAHPQPFGPEMMKALDAYEKHQDETPETGMLDAFFILRDSIRVDTTTTDAFLAEVRNEAGALAVELFAQTLGSPYSVRDEKCYEDGFTRAIEVVRDIQAPRFAYKIRQAGM